MYLTRWWLNTHLRTRKKFLELRQLVVGQKDHRDEMVLKLELKDTTANADKNKLLLDINNKFQDICRIKIDKVEVVPDGTIGEKGQGIKDVRKWE